MLRALEEVAAGMIVRQASRVFRVPRNTLRDRVSGRVTHGSQSGPKRKLSAVDEEALVQYCLYCSAHGFPLTRARLLAYAVMKKRSQEEHQPPLGKRRWYCFRHAAVLSMRTPDNIDRARACCATMETVSRYFVLLEKTLTEHGLRDKPAQVYNCDETGFSMEKSRCKMLARRGTKHPFLQAPGTRDHVSVLACFNAAGEDVPPMIIYSKHFPGGRYTEGGPPNALYGKSPAGYIDGEQFFYMREMATITVRNL